METGEKLQFRTSRKERVSYSLFFAGEGMFTGLVAGFVQLFLTDSGLTAIDVGLISIVARVWDAINDPLFGGIIEKTHFKGGKFLPWIRIGTWLVPLFAVLVFLMPQGFPHSGKFVWAVVTFISFGMAYTIVDVPIFGLSAAMTDIVQERTTIMSQRSVSNSIALLAVTVLIPVLYPILGWPITILILGILGFVFMSFAGRNVKERFVSRSEESASIKSMLIYLKNNKYLMIFFGALLIMNITNTIISVATYFALYCLGSAAMMVPVMLCVLLPPLVFAVICPKLTRRYDKFNIFMVALVASIVFSAISYFAGYENFVLFAILLTVKSLFIGANTVLIFMFCADCIEYSHFKTGERMEGVAFSIQTFVCLFMNAIAASITMFVMGSFGFVEGTGAIQGESTLWSMWLLITLFPAIGMVLSLPLFTRYKLRDHDVQLMAKANAGEISRDEAEAGFLHKF